MNPNAAVLSTSLHETEKALPPSEHPLGRSWVLWYADRSLRDTESQEAVPWEKSLVQISDINTVEKYWSTANHIKRPSALVFGAKYCLFKKGIAPAWEDPTNRLGGQWIVVLHDHEDMASLNAVWESLTLSLIGEYFYDPLEGVYPDVVDAVCGVVLTRKRHGTRLALWVSGAAGPDVVGAIGEQVRNILSPVPVSMEYVSHKEKLEAMQ